MRLCRLGPSSTFNFSLPCTRSQVSAKPLVTIITNVIIVVIIWPGAWSGDSGMDSWCTTNCNHPIPYCPPTQVILLVTIIIVRIWWQLCWQWKNSDEDEHQIVHPRLWTITKSKDSMAMMMIQPVFLWRDLCSPGFNCSTTSWSVCHLCSSSRRACPTSWRKQPPPRTHLSHLPHLLPLPLPLPGDKHCFKHWINVLLAFGQILL